MPVSLRCPGCGKVYQLADDRAGKQAKCPCGGVMKVPAWEPGREDPAWEEEVVRALGPSPASGLQEMERKAGEPPCPGPAQRPAATMPASRELHPEADVTPQGRKRAADAPAPFSSWIASLGKIDLRGLLRKEPWRAVFGLAAVAYGVAAVPVILSGVSLWSVGALLFGDAASGLAQAAVAGAIAFGGLLILKKDKNGPACAGLAAVLFCFVPMWGLLPGLRAALRTEQFAPLVWIVAQYAVPIALMVWCLQEETRRQH